MVDRTYALFFRFIFEDLSAFLKAMHLVPQEERALWSANKLPKWGCVARVLDRCQLANKWVSRRAFKVN